MVEENFFDECYGHGELHGRTMETMHPVAITFQISWRLLAKFINNEMSAASNRTLPNTAPTAAKDDDIISSPFIITIRR